MTRIPGWLRRLRQAIPLLRSHLGKHTQQALEAWLDMQYARRLRRMNARPVYTPPQKYRVVPDYMQPGSYASVTEVHHGRAGELHKDVLAACIGKPDLLDDIRTERTKNDRPADSGPRRQELMPLGVDRLGEAGRLDLPGRGALTSADMTKLAPAGELNVTGQVSVAGPLAGDLHQRDWTVRQLSVVRDGLAPWVVEALSSVNASGEDTAVRRTWPQWLLGIRSCAIGDLDLAVKAATTDLQMWGRKIASEVQPSWPAS